MKKEEKFRFKWSRAVKLMTILSLFIIIAPLFTIPTIKDFSFSLITIYGVITLSLLWVFLFTMPVYAYIDGGKAALRIKMPLRSKDIPLNEIVSIRAIDKKTVKEGTIRTFGSGGFLGYLGYFHNYTLGHFEMYATEMQNLVLIETKSKKYVISTIDYDKLLKSIELQAA